MIKNVVLLMLLGFVIPTWGETPQLETAMAQGQWTTVERLLAKRQDTAGLLMRGEARRVLGYLDAAHGDHETAWQQAETPTLKIWAGRTSAETLLAMHKYAEAEKRVQAIPDGCAAAECAKLALMQGRLQAALERFDEALLAYQQARDYARTAGLTTLGIQAQLAAMDIEPGTQESMQAIAQEMQQVSPTYVQTVLRLGLAERARLLGYPNLAQTLLDQAAPNVTPGRQRADFLALQASLLEEAEAHSAALQTVEKVIKEARHIGAGDLLMNGEWQRGRLYHALGDGRRALAAFRRALFHLEAIRTDIPVEYKAGHSSFRETLSPLYLETVDLLLKQAATSSEATAQSLLLEARDVIERLKSAELQDYLGESCPLAAKAMANLEAISPRTGVLYPIILPDRLVLLLGIGKHQHQKVVEVEAEILNAKARDLGAQLREPPDENGPMLPPKDIANQLFAWLIAPLKAQLEAAHIETLVVVPDGALRLFPFAALMDGDEFLVERYAVVTAPSLTIMAPKPLARGNIKALIAGMSRPGPVVDELAQMAATGGGTVRGLVVTDGAQKRGLRGLTLTPGTGKTRAGNFGTTPDLSPEARQAKIEELALPGVDAEVAKISKVLGSTPMLNQDFTLDNFSQRLQQQHWNIVHVATHGYFGGTPETSFFMTYDRLLKMGKLQSAISGRVGSDPPDLLTLSACQTAEGNDRAPLGITGVAVKSGARSALGSLWPVSDDATQLLISEFYRNLLDPSQTKAQAFQKAQITVLKREEFQHPFFWSPFILIGNWL